MLLRFVLNGELIEARDLDPNVTLLDFLRLRGLTGCKEACGEGECGACSVVITRAEGSGSRYEAVHACLTLVHALADHEVRTVEGVCGNGALHPIQTALVEHGASQCGYCTPGFVMSLFAEYYRPGRCEVDLESIAGNLCRCTGYRPIKDAARSLPAATSNDPHLLHLNEPPRPRRSLKLVQGKRRFARPTSLSEVWSVLAEWPDAKLIAGGTDVVVEMNQLHRRFDALVALDEVPELQQIAEDDSAITIGAGLRLTEIERRLQGRVRALDMLWPLYGSRLVRARATLGGNLATASPIGDASPVLLALDAELELSSERGTRVVSIAQFFTAYRKTLLEPGELIHRVRVPKPLAQHSRFYKVSKRVADDISSVAGAFALTVFDGRIGSARVAYGGVAEVPLRLPKLESLLTGAELNDALIAAAKAALPALIQPISDVRASAAYRLRVAQALLERVLRDPELVAARNVAAGANTP